MQRVAVGLLVLAGVMILTSIGCVSEERFNSVLLRNREQEKLLAEKDSQIAGLTERVSALTARATDAQRMLAEKEDHLSSVMKERDELRRSFDQLMLAYGKLANRAPVMPGGQIPEKVAIEIKQLADQFPGMFEFDEATGRLRFAADITFDSGSNVVKPDARTALTKLGGILTSDIAKDIMVSIVGHTDTDPVKKPATIALLKELGKESNNKGLSQARAESVAEVLKAAKIEAGRIKTSGVGESQPEGDNRSAEGKAKNRRVEIFLTMSGSAPAPAKAGRAAVDLPLVP